MKNTYFLSFKIPTNFEANFFKDFAWQLKEFGINNKQKLEEIGKIDTVFQNEQFEISLENYKNFPHVFKIQTNVECTIAKRGGFITLIWRILNWKYNIEYGEIEFFTKEAFELVNNRFHLRFINYQLLHKIIDITEVIEPIEFLEYSNERATIKQTTISCINYSAEQIWISIAKALDYDGWDTVNGEFVPLTLEEYHQETISFAEFWNIEPEKYLLPDRPVLSILRLGRQWDFNEYLVEIDGAIHYIRTDVWTD